MALKFECGIMKVGNSTVMVLPKSLCDNFGIKPADTEKKQKPVKLQVLATENGMFIPLKQKEELKEKITELLKEMKK
ncbi:MAG: hypothetical protein ACYDAJ_11730 [Nitrosotalea sp.]